MLLVTASPAALGARLRCGHHCRQWRVPCDGVCVTLPCRVRHRGALPAVDDDRLRDRRPGSADRGRRRRHHHRVRCITARRPARLHYGPHRMVYANACRARCPARLPRSVAVDAQPGYNPRFGGAGERVHVVAARSARHSDRHGGRCVGYALRRQTLISPVTSRLGMFPGGDGYGRLEDAIVEWRDRAHAGSRVAAAADATGGRFDEWASATD